MIRSIPTLLLVGLLCGLAYGDPVSPDIAVRAKAASRDKFYSVQGRNAEEIFASIHKQGLGNLPGRAASGLTESRLQYAVESHHRTAEPCRIQSLELALDILITLPKHHNKAALDSTVRRHWEIYETVVEAHEYQHVEIEIRGLEEVKHRLRQALNETEITDTSPTACKNLVANIVREQQKVTQGRHEDFHRTDATEVLTLQDNAKADLLEFDAELLRQGAALQELDDLIQEAREEQEYLRRHLTESASGNLALATQSSRQKLSLEYNHLVEDLNITIARHNVLLQKFRQAEGKRESLRQNLLWIR